MSVEQVKFSFPRINRVELEGFSLYSRQKKIDVEMTPGVVCLAGANGIGKSTFLAAVNYGLTGAVPLPSRSFLAAAPYLENSRKFSSGFFEGRITELDRSVAAVYLEIALGDSTYCIRRGVFDGPELRDLTIKSNGQETSFADITAAEREVKYREMIAMHSGFMHFEQFAFFQHFILSFDEGRHLLLWNERSLEQALYLCFGGSLEEATRSEDLRRAEETLGSQARNYRFQAANVQKRISQLTAVTGKTGTLFDAENEVLKYEALTLSLSEAEAEHATTETAHRSALIRRAQETAKVESLRARYAEEFSQHVGRGGHVHQHPIIRGILTTGTCGVCGTNSSTAAGRVTAALEAGKCPVCDEPIAAPEAEGPKSLQGLKELDQSISEGRRALKALTAECERLEDELALATAKLSDKQKKLEEYERTSVTDIAQLKSQIADGKIAEEKIGNLRQQYDDSIRQSVEKYAERDRAKDQRRSLQKSFAQRYATAEESFLPMFKSLANLFLGIDVDVTMQISDKGQVTLALNLENTPRRQEHQLSESQKYFIDIALRMALARFVASRGHEATLFVDTPEGSLDIAYENRAGQMFADFVGGGERILMTANINTSQLLLKLAEKCGQAKMKLVRMTSWSDLSLVQTDALALFEEAFDKIDRRLKGENNAVQP